MYSFLYLGMLLFILTWVVLHLSGTALQIIKVDPVNGSNDQVCLNGIGSCRSLNYALGGVNHSNITIQLFNGLIHLSSFNNTMSNLSFINITGTGITTTTIQCSDTKAGLYFVGIRNLTIANLTISNCGMLQNSTIWNNSSPVQYPSAVTIFNSSNITIESVSFKLNNGIGLSIVNTGGAVTILRSVFDSNQVTSGDYPGGGGLYIEFSFCFLDNNFASYSNYSISYSHYIVDTCNFTNNFAKKMEITAQFPNTNSFSYTEQTFGHGGGMSVFFRCYSTNNTINVINTKFIGNTAVWGGGLFIKFDHHASGNKIFVKENSQFSNNHCNDDDDPEGPGGGAAQIAYNSYNSTVSPSYNHVSFSQSTFTFNKAYWGGGIAYLLGNEQQPLGTNLLCFLNCYWYGNLAKFGAAIDLYRSLSTEVAQAVVLENCSFINNSAFYNLQADQFELQGAGVVYATSFIITFKGFVAFTRNNGSALVLFTSHVHISDGCNVTFTQNKGWRGGALSLLASSWIKVGENAIVVFDKNNADEVGGAVYVELISEHKVVSQWNCFIQFIKPNVPPDDWTAKIQFQWNHAFFGGHAIFATTLHSCVWRKNSTHFDKDDIKNAFHWKSFEFDGKPGTYTFSKEKEIATAANNLTAYQRTVMVSPGEKYPLPFEHIDDEGHNAKTIFFIQSDDTTGSVDNQSIYIYDDIMQVYGKPNTTFNITVTNLGPIPSTVTLNVTFEHCPPGYIAYVKEKYDNTTSCKCANGLPDKSSDGIPGISECDYISYRAYITRYYWGGIHEPSGNFVTADCPQDYCTFEKSKYSALLPRKRSDLDLFQCQKQHRTGTICGECMEGYSISSQSNCVQCKHGTLKGLGLFLLYECLPTILFISFILILNLNITSGYWNSLIFYFQIVETLNLYSLQSINEYSGTIQILIKIHKYAFGIWNLEYYSPDVCYINKLRNVLGLYLLKFFTVVIAILVVGAAVLINKLRCPSYGHNFHQNIEENVEGGFGSQFKKQYNKIIEKLKRFKLFGERKAELIHGIATVLVLSYTKIALLSMKFFIPGKIYSSHNKVVETRVHHVGTMKYFHGIHLYYVIIPMILLPFSAVIPFYLILKAILMFINSKGEYKWCKKCDEALYCCCSKRKQDKFNQFLNEFYGSFEKDCRFYAGMFFVYRLALYATFAFTPSLMIQYCVQQCLFGAFLFMHSIFQPYGGKYAFANKLDAMIFMNLNIINALSVYNFYSVVDIQSESQAKPTLIVQLVLVYLPLLYIPIRFIWHCRQVYGMDPLSYISIRIFRYCKQVCKGQDDNFHPLRNVTEDVNPDVDLNVDLEAQRDVWQEEDKSVDVSGYDHVESQGDPRSTANSTIPSYRPPQIDRFQNAS